MNEKNTRSLLEDFDFFSRLHDDVTLEYEFECSDGWYNLLYKLCKDIQTILEASPRRISDDFRVVQVKEKFGCYDEKTEVLTKNGWKRFRDTTLEDEIAVLDNGTRLSYCKPTDII